MQNNFQKVLIVELTRLGDIISGYPAIKMLKTAYPSSDITVLVEPFYGDLLKGSPYIKKVMAFRKTNTIFGLVSAICHIRKEKFDLAISLSPAKRNSLITYFSKARYKIGYFILKSKFPGLDEAKIMAFGLRLNKTMVYKKDENIVERALKSLRALGIDISHYEKEIFVPEPDILFIKNYLMRVRKNSKLISIQPCSNWKHKDWPKENYIRLINAIADRDIFLLGTKKDEAAINEIVSKTDRKAVAFVNMPLLKVAALIKNSDLFLGPDSGLMHIAEAVGTPIIGLFGPTDPEMSGPSVESVTLMRKATPCSPCKQRGDCPATVTCMAAIKVEEVLKAINDRLTNK